ncbi:anhydro-N-acetylmuramic acid kinase [Deinococcus peraridilitoris]|uniref:Anhydro-N-acetylmuramic acid kinase n=1 Tax=Deinococcus peraridilitoris (strain DSM 19664 / LMG 22246 / CIP 109416 / KR-200) TaxID=937777 RepID=L0A8S4_DEIPD|nr:anhydro-N-acetylmuramic acid kinase [Deinococcus peraridilitoris]AFZ69470.1 molecular chaperone [Deinococcus peraridilitoris DSM 19664]
MTRAPRLLGLMNGTSVDGIDAVLLELPGWPAVGEAGSPAELHGPAPRARILAHRYTPFRDDLRDALLRASRNNANTSEITQLHFWLGETLADAAAELSPDADLIASHGQTIHHIPHLDEQHGWHTRSTLQIGEASLIAERTGKPVLSDFRPPDLAAGGQAAPLVPFADRILYAEHGVRRAIHNLGGISNLTYLPGLDAHGVLAFDTGPANALIDEAAELFERRYDDSGKMAASGRVADTLVQTWLREPYLQLAPPKSTGRERWNLQRLPGVFELDARDIAATVTAFSAASIADAYHHFVLPRGLDEIIVAGGGAYNPTLMGQLRDALAPIPVLTFEERGWNSSAREAAAFGILGYYAYQGWPNTLPHTTGARHAVIAGKLSRPPREHS